MDVSIHDASINHMLCLHINTLYYDKKVYMLSKRLIYIHFMDYSFKISLLTCHTCIHYDCNSIYKLTQVCFIYNIFYNANL